MAGNSLADNSGNIYVETAYNNIILVDPNKTTKVGTNGRQIVEERIVDHENLVMYANLEAEILPRTKLAIGGNPQDNLRTISLAKINFLKPNGDEFLNVGFYDDLTGLGARSGKSRLQKFETIVDTTDGKQFYKQSVVSDERGRTVDPGLLGITSIEVKTNMSFIPEVVIRLEDVQGKALFEQGDQSPYAAFFNLPYPVFYLTMKGYYGQAIRYQLNLHKFTTDFNSFSGNYQVTCQFFGYKYNILNEISLGSLMALPHMYTTTYNVSSNFVGTDFSRGETESQILNQNQFGGSSDLDENEISQEIVTSKGYQKIKEMYDEYEAKGLIPKGFPRYTIAQLSYKLQRLEQDILSVYKGKADFQPLTDAQSYRKFLRQYFSKVRGDKNSWFTQYLNPKPYVLKENGGVIFGFKKDLDQPARDEAVSKLKSIITEYNRRLDENRTFGQQRGKNLQIQNPINYNIIALPDVTFDQIDWVQTMRTQLNVVEPNEIEVSTFISNELRNLSLTVEVTRDGLKEIKQPFFVFVGQNRFDGVISSMESQLDRKVSVVESEITEKLKETIASPETGIGFVPSVRNIMAVIMASAEGFIRLIDEVHTKAWQVREDPIRKSVVLRSDTSVLNSDSKDYVPYSANVSNTTLENAEIPIYPWPQVFIENEDPKKGKYELAYPGDPNIVNLTKGYLYDKWPEVEFVEEFFKGITQKLLPPISNKSSDNEVALTNRLNLNAIEFPAVALSYINKEELRFFYEIYERQFLYSFYTNFGRINNSAVKTSIIEAIANTESNNIISSLGVSNPNLIFKLKNSPLSSSTYPSLLRQFSNEGTGLAYQEYIRDIFVTPYIRNFTQDSFSILPLETITSVSRSTFTSLQNSTVIKQLLDETSTNTPTITDTYPFTNLEWNVLNLNNYEFTSGLNNTFNTTKTYKVYQPKNLITNFENPLDKNLIRPVVSFDYRKPESPSPSLGFSNFYAQRNVYLPTEGVVPTDGSRLPNKVTTSMLNTPYMVNAIQYGVTKQKSGSNNPYVEAAYLFINSLPLSTFKERYKSFNVDSPNALSQLDYIFASFKKFGAVHKVPYAWVLKYGSIWHRYKTFIQSGNLETDILSPVWTNYNYALNYDPSSSDVSKVYDLSIGKIKLQDEFVVNGVKTTSLDVGFYPKTINDFNFFLNGYDLFSQYTNGEIDQAISNGLKIQNLSESNIFKNTSSTAGQTRTIDITTYSCVVPSSIEPSEPGKLSCTEPVKTPRTNYYILPSFGSNFNEVNEACFNTNGQLTQELSFNDSVYNGTVRTFWKAPNYGYFNNDIIVKPPFDAYTNLIPRLGKVLAFELLTTGNYSKFDEMFSVFERSIFDKMEIEFLNFAQALNDYKPNSSEKDPFIVNATNELISPDQQSLNVTFKNFQSLYRSLMSVPLPGVYANQEDLFSKIIENQYSIIVPQLQAFLEYDVALRVGNPTGFRRRVVDSYISYVTQQQQIADPIQFGSYKTDTLPTNGGSVSLQQSRLNNPLAWSELDLDVGFSTIPDLIYKNSGSYITDFFVDSNIDFTQQNVFQLSEIIKQYATEKLSNPSLTARDFAGQLSAYVNDNESFYNTTLDNTISIFQKGLPNISEVPERVISSQIDGKQSKVEVWEMFKALNDKWIAGYDNTQTTLFEDMMFLDRASKNIGDLVIIDIFDLQNFVADDSLNLDMSVFVFVSGILTKNNFSVMPMPAYVNFYNVQNINNQSPEESVSDFANNMWGTFLTLDYRNAGPKLVCFYTDRPSSYLDMKDNKNYLFRSDAFDLRDPTNPLSYDDKDVDKVKSNKVVGFNVDIGIRNQNIFNAFNISQDSGRATSESIQQINLMSNSANGRSTSTQNVSLYNIYKNMSYQCEVAGLGNALIQPTMYFNLRHVPMFNGSYMITEVDHSIQPGSFQTKFKGIRQSVYNLPIIDVYLQSINKNLLQKILKVVAQRKDDPTQNGRSTTTQGANANTTQGTTTITAQNACVSKLVEPYSTETLGYESIAGVLTRVTEKEMYNFIRKVTNNTDLQYVMYLISYVASFKDGNFTSYNNNYGQVVLTYDYGELSRYFGRFYTCQLSKTESGSELSLPYATFLTVEDYLLFLRDKLSPALPNITQRSISTYYLQLFPYRRGNNQVTTIQVTSRLKRGKISLDGLSPQITSNIPLLPPDPVVTPSVNNLGNIPATPVCLTPTPTPTKGTVAGSSQSNLPPAPTPTPSRSGVGPANTIDKQTLLTATQTNGATFNIGYTSVGQSQGFLSGNFVVTTASLQNTYPATLAIKNGSQTLQVANFTVGPNGGTFISSQSGYNTSLPQIVTPPQTSVTFQVTVQTPTPYTFTYYVPINSL
jgi:hypothetical protein